MELIHFHCPSCHHRLVVPPEAAAQSGPCPDCGVIIHGPNSPGARSESTPKENPPATPQPPTDDPQPVEEAPSKEPAARPAAQDDPPRERPRSAPAAPPRSGLSLPLVFALVFLSSALFFALGFFVGKNAGPAIPPAQPPSPTNKADPAPAETTPDENADTPDEERPAVSEPAALPPETPQDPPENTDASAAARATLNAFLAAKSWTVRNAYVHNPDEVLADMESLAERFGDGTIETTDIAFLADNADEKVFRVQIQGQENPFPISMVQGDGMWKVAWESFAEFYYDQFERFATGDEGPSEKTFRLQIKPAPGETDPLAPARVIARAPHATEGHQLTLSNDSPARRALAKLFATYHEQRPEVLQNAFDTGGLPLLVTVSRSGGENPSLSLEEIVSNTWMTQKSER